MDANFYPANTELVRRRWRMLFGIVFFFVLSHLIDWGPFNLLVTVYAQATTVTGTVKDTNGVPYAGASLKAQLVLAGANVTGQPVVTVSSQAQCISAGAGNAPCKIPFQGTNGPISLDPTGSFTLNLQDNSLVTPASTQWLFTVNTPGSPPPLGTGPQTCSATITISGSSQSISSNFSACPALSNSSTGGGGGVVGGTFGGSPSSGYTFTSTPIATNPFNGNLLVGANINGAATGTYTAGSGYTLIGSTAALGFEYGTATTATSYSSAFTYSVSSGNWGGTIAAFSSPGNNAALVQGKVTAGVTTLAYASNNGAGNLLVAVFRYNGLNAGQISAVTDTTGNTWSSAGERCFEGYAKGISDNNYLEVWYAVGSIAGANTVTPTLGAGVTGGSVIIGIAEFSGVSVSISNALVDYNFTGSTTGVTSIPGATTNTQYTINAVNNATGVIDFTGRDSGAVFRSATNARATTGGKFYFKNGIYPGQTSLHESVAGQTNWYIWSFPATGSSTQVAWHVECESFTQILYASLQTDGCIHQVMPSAYAGPQPAGVQLSGFWQRPSAAFGATTNNAIFLVNGTCRIPDNQHTPTICWDLFTSTYSSHIGTVADTVITATDQLCSGLTPAVSNTTGFRTNNFGTDETYFENTWVVGYSTPYNVISNHPVGINMHASCNVNAGSFAIGGSLYGGLLIHFQDNHNINGLTLNCQSGTRLDILNHIQEFALSGAFSRNVNATEINPGNCVGKVDFTTGSANSVAFSPGAGFFVSGSGANMRGNESTKLLPTGLITSNFTSAATTGTTKQTLATYTFVYNNTAPGPQNGPFQNNSGATFRIKAWGITAANADSKTVEIDFGGTAIATITSTVNAGAIKCEAEILVSSVANTQEILGYCDDGATRTVTRTAPGITGNANIIANLAATTGTAAGDFTFKGWTVEYVGGN